MGVIRLVVALGVACCSLFVGAPASAGGISCPPDYQTYNIPKAANQDLAGGFVAQPLPKGQYAMAADLYASPYPPPDPAVVLCGKPSPTTNRGLKVGLFVVMAGGILLLGYCLGVKGTKNSVSPL